MKKTLFAAMTALFIISLSLNVFAEVKTVEIKTSAVCGDCKTRIESATKDLKGVLESNLNLESKIATVKYDDSKTNPGKIRKGISYAGYQADDFKANKKAYSKLPAKCKASACCSSSKKCSDKKACSDKKSCSDKKGEVKQTKSGCCGGHTK